ncbi:hypothetical protein MUP56_01110 [Patescibacteria group bacterium]|nr:hypothetical protein [Patescibacteria group bacterium]
MEILFFICISVISRLVPHLPNMTPVGAVALFTGSKYRFGTSVFIVGISMVCSDFILGFHPVMWATYGSFLITILLGRLLKEQNNWKLIGIIAFLSSCQFFILTNFAVWQTGLMYPKTIAGLIQCFVMALPFFRNSLLGDLFYTTILFGAFEIVARLRYSYRAHILA